MARRDTISVAPLQDAVWPARQRKTTMSRFRFHKLAALVVLAGFVAWTATGEFSSVGSIRTVYYGAPRTITLRLTARY